MTDHAVKALWCALALALVTPGCANPRKVGDVCFETGECGSGSDCVQTSVGRFCLLPCPGTQLFCEDGEVCAESEEEAGSFYCLTGGEIEVGQDCDTTVECELGALCVNDDNDTECEVACDPSAANQCAGDDVCIALDGVEQDRGFCKDIN